MGTATILGDTYQTVVMPDGKEWLAENLKWTGAGAWWNNGASNDGDGRYYTRESAVGAVSSALVGTPWRLATEAEITALAVSVGGLSVAGKALKTSGTTYWLTNTGVTDAYGFGLHGAGRQWVGWQLKKQIAFQWLGGEAAPYWGADDNASPLFIGSDPSHTVWLANIRLIRDVPYLPADAHETTHTMALEWTEAADGTPVAYDDGAAYDYIESTITARMTPAELIDLETAWQSSTKLYTIYSTGYLLGPLIDMNAGVEVRLMSYQVDQSADSAMTLYDVTIGVHYGPLSAPSAGSLAVVQSRGRPYHSVAPGAASWITEGGSSDVNAYGRASERSCTWYTHSLTTAQAADVVNALRTLRGSSTTWAAGGVATPWGPSESGTATVWIPEWSVHRESNLLWGVQMELVRNG